MANNQPQDQQRRPDQRQAQPGRPERDNASEGQERPESEDVDAEEGDIERPQ